MTHERRQLEYAIEVMRQKYVMVAAIGPATDRPVEGRIRLDAIAFAAHRLQRPYFPVSPFI